ncbi:MAG TPA: hypothetical protein VFV43_05200 [Limnobacter sp.]|nr:hypothetical protein [Limnobacter sp.]
MTKKRFTPRRFFAYTTLLILTATFVQTVPAQAQGRPAVDWRDALPEFITPPEHTRIEIRQAQIAVQDQLVLDVLALNGQLVPSQTGEPINLDEPGGYRVEIEHAQIVMNDKAIAHAVQTELAQSSAPIRIERVDTNTEGVRIEGKIKRLGLWLSFHMEGKPSISGPGSIALRPNRMVVAGIPIYKALLATNIELESLVNMKSRSVFVDGQHMVLKPQQLLDQPSMEFDLLSLSLLEGGIHATLGKRQQPPPSFCQASPCPTSYVYTTGGQVQAAGLTLAGKPTLATGKHGAPLSLSLNDLQDTLRTSTVMLRADGAAWIKTDAGPLPEPNSTALAQGVRVLQGLEIAWPANQKHALLIAVHHADLRTSQGIDVRVEKLLSFSKAKSLDQLPLQEQTVVVGHIELSEPALDALMNNHLFAYEHSPVRQVRTHVHALGLDLRLQVRPNIFGLPTFWLPARLGGELQVSKDKRSLSFTPSAVHIFGLSMQAMLNWLGIELSDLISVDQAAVKLQGNTLTIALGQALPPMQLNTQIQALRLVERSNKGHYVQMHVGLVDGQTTGQLYSALEELPAGLWLKTAEFEALGMLTGPSTAHIHTLDYATRVQVDLGRYPGLLSEGEIRLPSAQQALVRMPTSQHPIQGHRHENHAH